MPGSNHIVARCVVSCAFVLLVALPIEAQVSLDPDDSFEANVWIDGELYTFTLIRDVQRLEKWYYFPQRPQLLERSAGGQEREPEFSLIRYQYDNPTQPEHPDEGAIVQFATTLVAHDDA